MSFTLKSYEFRKEREASWHELEALVFKAEKRGIKALSAGELSRLPTLYRSCISSLSVARAISLDSNVLAYLEALTGRAYLCVYGTRRHFSDALRELFLVRFPSLVRSIKWHLLLATAILLLGIVTGFVMTLADSDNFYSFVGGDLAGERTPDASTAQLSDALYTDESGFEDGLFTFAAFLFTHNARIGLTCFALGFLAGIPVFFLLFMTGLMLGGFSALYHSRGLGIDFWGWVLPHGITEILALLLCAAAGLKLGQALVFPGRRRRLVNLRGAGRDMIVIALACVFMFFIAGLIEGFFRQLVMDIGVRYLVVAASVGFWLWFFLFVGRRREAPR